ncbi:hypothetical protein H8959_010773 [Pygathrix nigripes]
MRKPQPKKALCEFKVDKASQVSARVHGRRVLWEEVVHSESVPEPPNTQLQSEATQHKSPVPQGSQERAMSTSQSPTPSQKGSSGDQEMTATLLTAGFQTLEKIEDMAVSLIREEWLLDPSQKDLSRDNRPENFRNVFSLGGETRSENRELASKQSVEICIPIQTQNAIFLTALQHFSSCITFTDSIESLSIYTYPSPPPVSVPVSAKEVDTLVMVMGVIQRKR